MDRSSSDSSLPGDEWRLVDIEQQRPAGDWSRHEPCHRPTQRRHGAKSEKFRNVVLDRRENDFGFGGYRRGDRLSRSCRRWLQFWLVIVAQATTCVLGRNNRPKSRVSGDTSMWVATSDWCDKLILSEQVGGRAHEAQCIRFVWSGGSSAFRNGGADAFSRHAFGRQCWQLKVLRQKWN